MSLCDSHNVSWGSWKSISVRNKFKWFPQRWLTQCEETVLYLYEQKKKLSPLFLCIYLSIITLSSSHPWHYLLIRLVLQARYKQSLDPTVDEVKKLCTSLRRNAKEERVLFHYNGHGVPRPTVNGEIWVFNKVWTPHDERNRVVTWKWIRGHVRIDAAKARWRDQLLSTFQWTVFVKWEQRLWNGEGHGECVVCGATHPHNSALWGI